MRLRRGLVACALGSLLTLGACRAFFDFDDFDTSEPAHNAAPTIATSFEAGTFDLIAPNTMTIAPGTTTHLPVSVARHADANGRVIITVAATPGGFAPILTTSIEPDASTAVLDLQAFATTPPEVVPLRINAVEGAITRTRDVSLTLRGPSCSPDLGFGLETNGLEHAQVQNPIGVLRTALYFAADGDRFLVTTTIDDADQPDEIDHIDEQALLDWSLIDDGAIVTASDGDGGAYVSSQQGVRRIVYGDSDPTFQPTLGRAAVTPNAMTATGLAGPVLLFTDANRWALEQLGSDGSLIGAGRAPIVPADGSFGASDASFTTNVLVQSGAGFFACGTIAHGDKSTEAVVSHWALDAAADPGFGATDFQTLAPNTTVVDCFADGAGIVAIGTLGVDNVLFVVHLDGTVDPPVTLGVSHPLKVVVDAATVVVLSGVAPYAQLSRYDRATGQLDPTFGASGHCALGPLGLGGATQMLPANDGKLLLLDVNYNAEVIGRLWL